MQKATYKIEEMFLNGNGKRRKDIERECSCYPNRIYRVNGWFVLVALQSTSGIDYAIGVRGRVRAKRSKDQGLVDNAYVVLADRDENDEPIYKNHQTLGNVDRILAGYEPSNFRKEFGPCHFAKGDFTVVDMGKSKNQHDDYEM